jgi:hypothetical protein
MQTLYQRVKQLLQLLVSLIVQIELAPLETGCRAKGHDSKFDGAGLIVGDPSEEVRKSRGR